MEKEIELEQEAIVVYSGGGAVNSVNGYTGDVILTTSDLENTSDYQTGTEVESAISTAIAGKQDTLTAGNNITISNNTISATDTTYSAGTGLTLNGTQFSVNTETIATQQDVSNEATARENADTNLQGQIDAISASSDVTDIVGTYADLQAYDTTHLKDNDIIKVLQDESQNDETTYYRWSTSTQSFTLIGEEGPYYTKSQTDTLLQAKQDNLTAGANITIGSDNTISATDTTYTAGTNVSISSGNVISATDTTYSDFTGTDGTAAGTAGLVPAPATTDAGKFLGASGLWEAVQAGGVTELTSADYNYPTNNPNSVGLWKLDTGLYHAAVGVKTYYAAGWSLNDTVENTFTIEKSGASTRITFIDGTETPVTAKTVLVNNQNGNVIASNNFSGKLSLTTYNALNALNNDTYISTPLSSYQGRVLNDKITGLAISGAGAPTTSTVGTVGKLYEDTTNGKLYICTAVSGSTYTWEEVGAGGGGPTVVQTTGTSTTDVMSQDATTSMVFADPSTKQKVQIGNSASAGGNNSVAVGYGASSGGTAATAIGRSANSEGSQSTAVGFESVARGTNSIALGHGATASSSKDGTISVGASAGANSGNASYSTQIGYFARATSNGGIALGSYSSASAVGEMNIGSTSTNYGYNSSNYRLLTGLYDGQSAHDAATYGQVISYSAINGAGAPTTATEGKYVGQLYYDTTNEAMYFLKTIDTTTTPATYTWAEVGAGGGSGPTVVQTTGTSTTDVMSQSAVTSMVFADPSTKEIVKLGVNATTSGYCPVAIGKAARATGDYSVAIGKEAYITASDCVAVGDESAAQFVGSVAIGAYSKTTAAGQMNIGAGTSNMGYNSSNYRLLTGLYDPQSAHDAATKGYVDARTLTNAGAPTTSTVGTVGQLLEDTTNGKLYICTDTTGGTYTWEEVGAGGGGPTVVQTTGYSQTDVMSQNAVTGLIYANPGTENKVAIGGASKAALGVYGISIGPNASGAIGATNTVSIGNTASTSGTGGVSIGASANAGGDNSVAIGKSSKVSASSCIAIGNSAAHTNINDPAPSGATPTVTIAIGNESAANNNRSAAIGWRALAYYNGSVALGAGAKPTSAGEVNIGSQYTAYGYNSSNYRLLTGLYDGQSAHDAVTVEQVNATIDAINTALSTNIPHIGA